MRLFTLVAFAAILFFSFSVSAAELRNPGNISGSGLYTIYNFTNVTSTKFCFTAGVCFTSVGGGSGQNISNSDSYITVANASGVIGANLTTFDLRYALLSFAQELYTNSTGLNTTLQGIASNVSTLNSSLTKVQSNQGLLITNVTGLNTTLQEVMTNVSNLNITVQQIIANFSTKGFGNVTINASTGFIPFSSNSTHLSLSNILYNSTRGNTCINCTVANNSFSVGGSSNLTGGTVYATNISGDVDTGASSPQISLTTANGATLLYGTSSISAGSSRVSASVGSTAQWRTTGAGTCFNCTVPNATLQVAGSTILGPTNSVVLVANTSNNKVGINTSTLTSTLEVNGNVSISQTSRIAGNQILDASGFAAENLTSGTLQDARLNTTAVNAGSYGNASNVTIFTVDIKGRLTAASSQAINISFNSVRYGEPGLCNATQDGLKSIGWYSNSSGLYNICVSAYSGFYPQVGTVWTANANGSVNITPSVSGLVAGTGMSLSTAANGTWTITSTVTGTGNASSNGTAAFLAEFDTTTSKLQNSLYSRSGTTTTNSGNQTVSGQLGVGMAANTLGFALEITGNSTIFSQSASTSSNNLRFYTRGNSTDSTAPLQNSQEVGWVGAYGWDGSAYGRGAYMVFETAQGYNTTQRGTRVKFVTTEKGSTTQTSQFRIEDGGPLVVGSLNTTLPPGLRGDAFAHSGLAMVVESNQEYPLLYGYAAGSSIVTAIGKRYFTTDTTASNNWSDSTNGSYLMVVRANGRVGINQFTPAYTLDVNGTGNFSDYLYTTNMTASKYYGGGVVTLTAGVGSGTSPTLTSNANSDCVNGNFNLTTGTTPTGTNSNVMNMSCDIAWSTKPFCVIWPTNANTIALGVTNIFPNYDTSSTSNTVFTSGALGLTGSTAYQYSYHCGG